MAVKWASEPSEELYVGRSAFDVELAQLNKLVIIILLSSPNWIQDSHTMFQSSKTR